MKKQHYYRPPKEKGYSDCFFTFLNTKTLRTKNPLWRNGTLFPETCHLSVYERVRHQDAKNHGELPLWVKKNLLQKNVSFEYF